MSSSEILLLSEHLENVLVANMLLMNLKTKSQVLVTGLLIMCNSRV